MLRSRRTIMLLTCALLALPGLAGAQPAPAPGSDAASPYRARNFYFVFKLGSTLGLTVQDTPECAGAADRQLVPGDLSSTLPRQITYSFVSSLDRAALAGALDTFLREHTFQAADLPPEERDHSGNVVEAVRTFTDPEAPGFSYTVRLHERPAGASVLCVKLRMPSADPASLSSQETS